MSSLCSHTFPPFLPELSTPVTPKSPALHVLSWRDGVSRKSFGTSDLPVFAELQAKVGPLLAALMFGEVSRVTLTLGSPICQSGQPWAWLVHKELRHL